MILRPDDGVPDGLTSRARSYVGTHGVKLEVQPAEDHRQWWLERGIPAGLVDRMTAYQKKWGGLHLPPAPQYDGGPRFFYPDSPETDNAGWWFEAGTQRTAVPFMFMIGPSGEFGIQADRAGWVPLHSSIEGWVESLALAHHASTWARQITRLVGDELDGIDFDNYEPVREVVGLADTWWRGSDSLAALYTGEAEGLDFPRARVALIYSGLDKWGLHGGVKADA
ncbi:hypothetical protein [Nocardia sp. XZ_19_385]|uniref:hypothetical protein n=1 Tax=Nocardia sp. XZ_19_385 TaxID=2769488 RepID=UPI00188ED918|nr:hypothetical protein [Nocardia sp. XZ_19_385]